MRRRHLQVPSRPGLAPADGYSLVEILISLAIVTLVYAAASAILVRVHMSNATNASTNSLRQGARVAMARSATEIRAAGSGLKTVTETFSTATATQLRFAADVDNGDTAAPCTNESGNNGVERITFRFQGPLFERSVDCWVGGTWQAEQAFTAAVGDLVAGSGQFQYFDPDGVELVPGGGGLSASDRANIARIRLSWVQESPDPAADGGSAVRHEAATDVLIRNNPTLLERMTGQ